MKSSIIRDLAKSENLLVVDFSETDHGKLKQPVNGCGCFDCLEKLYPVEQEQEKTKLRRSEGY